MSGGHWNYPQDKLRDFGEQLQSPEEHISVQAAGKLLVEIADILGRLDRIYCCDDSREKLPGRTLAELARVIGVDRVKGGAISQIKALLSELEQIGK